MKNNFESENLVVISKENFLNGKELNYYISEVNDTYNLGIMCDFCEENKICEITDTFLDYNGSYIYDGEKIYPKDSLSPADLEGSLGNFDISDTLQSYFGWEVNFANKRVSNKKAREIWFHLKENLPKKGWKLYNLPRSDENPLIPKKVELLFFNKMPTEINEENGFEIFENILHQTNDDESFNFFIKTKGMFTENNEDIIIFFDAKKKVGFYIYYKNIIFPNNVDLDYINIYSLENYSFNLTDKILSELCENYKINEETIFSADEFWKSLVNNTSLQKKLLLIIRR
jgi:hypothetical protein